MDNQTPDLQMILGIPTTELVEVEIQGVEADIIIAKGSYNYNPATWRTVGQIVAIVYAGSTGIPIMGEVSELWKVLSVDKVPVHPMAAINSPLASKMKTVIRVQMQKGDAR